MAAAKRKSSAKRATKTMRKTQSKAAHAAGSVARSAASQQSQFARQGAAWAERSAQEWQKGANEWAKQSAKLYQLPFGNNDAAAATQQAAEQVKSATESFVRAGSDMMSQMFGGTDPMAQWKGWMNQATTKAQHLPNAEEAAEKMRDFSRESAAQATRMAGDATRAMTEAGELARENAEAFVECNNIAIAVSKEIGAELISYTNRTFSQNVELGKQLFACRTLNDMFDLSSKFMKTNFDGFFSETVRLSEKLFQLGNDVAEPLNERFSDSSERMSRAIQS